VELIGINLDSSGLYEIYRDGDVFIIFHGDDATAEEIARQTLRLDSSFEVGSEEDWSLYGSNGHTWDIDTEENDHARIDGVAYRLIDLRACAGLREPFPYSAMEF